MTAALGHPNGGQGHCLCGAVRYSFDGPPLWQAYCHCESCRRNCSAPVAAFFGVLNTQWRWTGAAPASYRHSPAALRYFCPHCGTPMAYASATRTDQTDFYAASLADPAAFQPEQHVHWDERLPWLHLGDDLPRA